MADREFLTLSSTGSVKSGAQSFSWSYKVYRSFLLFSLIGFHDVPGSSNPLGENY